MIRIKLATGDDWTLDRAEDYEICHDGHMNIVDGDGVPVASVGPGQWVYVEIPPES